MDNTAQTIIDPETQKRLNSPLPMPQALSAENQQFLDTMTAKIESGRINLYSPDSLINHAVYNALPIEAQGKVDFDAVNLLSTLRDIYGLWKIYRSPTYQIENLVQQVRLTKERLENISGDVYVI